MPLFVVDTNRTSLFGVAQPMVHPHTLATYTSHIYDGCEFGCAYCTGWGLPRSLNESVRLMPGIAQRARNELATIDRTTVVGLTELSDAYQSGEQQYRRTRAVLQMMADVAQPVSIMTKSAHVLDDAELLHHIHTRSFAMVIVTIVSHIASLQQRLEERCDSTEARLDTVRQLKKLGIPVGVAMQPLLPYLNDTDYAIKKLLEMIADAGADFVYWDYLTISNQRHRSRLGDAMVRVNQFRPAFLRELYDNRETIDPRYRSERDHYIVDVCDSLYLPLALPYQRFFKRLNPRDEVVAVLLQLAYRDSMVGRDMLAIQGKTLAERVVAGHVTPSDFYRYAHYDVVYPLLVQANYVDDNPRMV